MPSAKRRQLDLRAHLALLAGKSAQRLLRLLRFGGDALPGLVAERVDPRILGKLAALIPDGVVAVCGTNGKTTTSRLVSAALRAQFPTQAHNRSGSNLRRGQVAALLQAVGWNGRAGASVAILETDEAVLEQLLAQVQPRAIVLHNLFRDQLDRYGEVDHIARRWIAALRSRLAPGTWLVVNADDPQLGWLARELGHSRTVFYGISAPQLGTQEAGSVIDTVYSPASGAPLTYARYYMSHLGDYADPGSGFARPPLGVSLVAAEATGETSQRLRLTAGSASAEAEVNLPGLYNAYNVLAAAALASAAFDVPIGASLPAMAAEPRAFGRFEVLSVGGRSLRVILIKNPVGASEVFRTIAQQSGPYDLAVAANDNYADGTDVSWYWDAQFELLGSRALVRCATLGTRRHDMALRLQYAGLAEAPELLEPSSSLFEWLAAGSAEVPVYVFATYTALLDLQRQLARRGEKASYWQE